MTLVNHVLFPLLSVTIIRSRLFRGLTIIHNQSQYINTFTLTRFPSHLQGPYAFYCSGIQYSIQDAMKGFSISSMPSAGHIKLTWFPLHTTRPSFLVSSVVLYGSLGSVETISLNTSHQNYNNNKHFSRRISSSTYPLKTLHIHPAPRSPADRTPSVLPGLLFLPAF